MTSIFCSAATLKKLEDLFTKDNNCHFYSCGGKNYSYSVKNYSCELDDSCHLSNCVMKFSTLTLYNMIQCSKCSTGTKVFTNINASFKKLFTFSTVIHISSTVFYNLSHLHPRFYSRMPDYCCFKGWNKRFTTTTITLFMSYRFGS